MLGSQNAAAYDHDHAASTAVEKQDAEGRAEVADGWWRYVDVDLLDKATGQATVGFIKSLSPVDGCTVLHSRGIENHSVTPKDIQIALLHIKTHRADLKRVEKIITDAQNLWLKTRAPTGLDTHAMQQQKLFIHNFVKNIGSTNNHPLLHQH